MKTAVVILNWNGKNFLEKFLPGLVQSLEGYDAEVIVADNASTDGSLEFLSNSMPDIRVLRFKDNYGFTGGYNHAFKRLGADNPEYFLLLNSDIEVTPGWFEPLEEWMDLHDDCAACAPKLHAWQEGRRDYFEYAGAAGGWLDKFGYPFCRGRVMSRTEKDEGQYDTPADVLWATGACLMVRSSVWRKLHGLDERFFAHMEEIDFCWRARLDGWRVNVVPRSLVYHLGGGTLPQNSPYKLYLNYRNNLLMLSNNCALTYVIRDLYYYLSLIASKMPGYSDDIENCQQVLEDEDRDRLFAQLAHLEYKAARLDIFIRMVLDGMSAAVYLFTGRFSYVKSVYKAHRDFRRMHKVVNEKSLQEILESDYEGTGYIARNLLSIDLYSGEKPVVEVKGILNRSIILLSLRYRNEIFDYLKTHIQ